MFDSHYADAVHVLQTVRNNPLSHLQKKSGALFWRRVPVRHFHEHLPNIKNAPLFSIDFLLLYLYFFVVILEQKRDRHLEAGSQSRFCSVFGRGLHFFVLSYFRVFVMLLMISLLKNGR